MVHLKELFADKKNQFTFCAAIIITLIVHYYVFTNMLINHDSVNYLLSGENIEYFFGCGRWFLYLIMWISSKITLPAVISMFCAISLAGTCVLLRNIFDIQCKINAIVLAFLLVSFPVVGNLLCYAYSADGLIVALFLGTLAAWLVLQKDKMLSFFALLILICTCGTHQSFWCMSLGIVFFSYFSQFLKNEVTINGVYKELFRIFVLYAVSIITYLIINRGILLITGFEAVEYAGLDKMFEFGGLKQILDIVYGANIEVFHFYFVEGNFIESPVYIIINILLFFYLVIYWIKNHPINSIKNFSDTIKFLILCIFAPSILNCVEIASKGYFHTVMMMSFVIPYIVCISCFETSIKLFNKLRRQKICISTMTVLLFLLSYTNYLTCNKMYTRQQLNYEATYGYLNRMLIRIEENEVYQQNSNVPVCFVNNPPNEKQHVDILTQNYPAKLSVFDECNGMVGNNVHTMIKNTRACLKILNCIKHMFLSPFSC